jgi:membrane protein YdbS with pleckstrin-like domain
MVRIVQNGKMMDDASIRAIRRPHSNLLRLYFLQAAATLIGFPFVFLPLYFKYHTLRYTFDDEGISASWGFLFKREIFLTYRRIQDIHVSRNLIERWLGIGKVEIQTASGSSSAELALEGMEHWDPVRDYLYRRMRGTGPVTGAATPAVSGARGAGALSPAGESGEAVELLRAIKADVEAVRRAVETGRPGD